jgi:putative ABC transport system substrate-binding protein
MSPFDPERTFVGSWTCAEKCYLRLKVAEVALAIERREFVKLIGGVVASWPLAAQAQQQSLPVIGYVTGSLKLSETFLTGVRKGLAELGYVEGQNYRFEFRDTNFQPDRNLILFQELAHQKVALFLIGVTSQIEQVKGATQSVPIVFFLGTDPVENGFITSLKKPGGNMTGVFNLHSIMTGKRLEVLRELVPSATKFAFLTNRAEALLSERETEAAQAAAHSLGVSLLIVNARHPNEVEAAFETAVRDGCRRHDRWIARDIRRSHGTGCADGALRPAYHFRLGQVCQAGRSDQLRHR